MPDMTCDEMAATLLVQLRHAELLTTQIRDARCLVLASYPKPDTPDALKSAMDTAQMIADELGELHTPTDAM